MGRMQCQQPKATLHSPASESSCGVCGLSRPCACRLPAPVQSIARCKQLVVALPGLARSQLPELAAYLKANASGAARAAAAAVDEVAAVVRYLQVGAAAGGRLAHAATS